VHREGRELVPTPKAFSLLFALHVMSIPELASPELTGEWEHKLKLIEAGKLTRDEFMQQISELVRKVVTVIKTGEIPDVVYATVSAPCPKCGGVVQENYRKFQCQKCDFNLWKVTSGREWSPDEVAQLITKRSIGPLTGFARNPVSRSSAPACCARRRRPSVAGGSRPSACWWRSRSRSWAGRCSASSSS
jgi:DNA topoisomerase-3